MHNESLVRCATVASLAISIACAGGYDGASGTISPDDRVVSVRVEPASVSLTAGAQQTLTATAHNSAGSVVTGRTFNWSSSSAAIASVDVNGVVTAVSAGNATITAATSGVVGNATITVSTPPGPDTVVARVSVTPPNTTLTVGSTASLGAVAMNAAGQVLAGKQFAWTSAAPAVASVNASGVVTGVSAGGPVTITASSAGVSGTAAITVQPAPIATGTITVNGAQQFQTMTGWEALYSTGFGGCDMQAYQIYMPQLIARTVDELKINRLRIPLRPASEQTSDAFLLVQNGSINLDQYTQLTGKPVNDNNDPFTINPAGFQWGHLDFAIEQTVLPLKQRLQAIGDDFWFGLGYTGSGAGANLYRDNPEEYAELVLAAFQHMQQKYGIVPNSFDIVNEPNLGLWTAQHVAANLLAVKGRLNQAGFSPLFIGPTVSGAAGSIQYFDAMMRVPGVAQALNVLSYHRYGGTLPTNLTDIASRGAQYGMQTAMLEHIGSGYVDLHDDLTMANVSTWQQFGLAWCTDNTDDGVGGGLYFVLHNARKGQTNPQVVTAKTSTYLRQYFRYVKLGAVRVGAATANAAFSPVAFRNPDGRYTVVVKATSGGSFTVGGLPAGAYGIEYTTASEYARSLADVTISSGQALSASIPAAGALTVYAK